MYPGSLKMHLTILTKKEDQPISFNVRLYLPVAPITNMV